MTGTLKKIAYAYFEKFRDMGEPIDPERDWKYAERALNHILLPRNESYWMWRINEEDFGEYRRFLPNELLTSTEEVNEDEPRD